MGVKATLQVHVGVGDVGMEVHIPIGVWVATKKFPFIIVAG
jgi:hypothetical protein